MKNKIRLTIIITIFMIIIISFFETKTFANNKSFDIRKAEYTEEYKAWLNLTDEEKEKTLMPIKYKAETNSNNVFDNTNNVFKMAKMLKASTDSRYSLKDVIRDNVNVKNQGNTNTCWAFASLGSLETNLALSDYKNSRPLKLYDYSERHMVYSSCRQAFLNDKINQKGFSVSLRQGGSYNMAISYLTNGSGAISENKMPFEDNEKNIDISTIQNKEPETTVDDVLVITGGNENRQETIGKMKTFISTYGGLYAGIHGANLLESNTYNNDTGAIYCDNANTQVMDHAVLIIGWDDNYSKDNFNENKKPTSNGAWIIKNSWGTSLDYTIEEFKEELFKEYKNEFISNGIDSSEEITDEFADERASEIGYLKTETGYSYKIGDNGYMYVSYEDVNIYTNVCGVQKVSDVESDRTIYQNDLLGATYAVVMDGDPNSKMYIANSFDRDSSKGEKIDRISIYTAQDYNNCKVYVNPNGDSKAKSDLIKANLKDGDSVNIKPGYHTIEFSEPIKLLGDKFVVVLEFDANTQTVITLESTLEPISQAAVVNENESFITTSESFEENEWEDIGDSEFKGNVNIKAFTTLDNEQSNSETNPEENQETNPTTDPEDNQEIIPETDNKTPTPSDFKNATAIIKESVIDTSNNGKVAMSIEVSEIEIGDINNKYTYYYCINDSDDSDDIDDDLWVEISANSFKKQSNGTYMISFDVSKNDLENIVDIEDSETIYLHIKEKAQLNGSSVNTTNTFKLQLVNDPIINNNKGINTVIEKDKVKGITEDKTIATKIIPYAGKISIAVAIIFIVGFGLYTYLRYRNIDK